MFFRKGKLLQLPIINQRIFKVFALTYSGIAIAVLIQFHLWIYIESTQLWSFLWRWRFRFAFWISFVYSNWASPATDILSYRWPQRLKNNDDIVDSYMHVCNRDIMAKSINEFEVSNLWLGRKSLYYCIIIWKYFSIPELLKR